MTLGLGESGDKYQLQRLLKRGKEIKPHDLRENTADKSTFPLW